MFTTEERDLLEDMISKRREVIDSRLLHIARENGGKLPSKPEETAEYLPLLETLKNLASIERKIDDNVDYGE